MDPLIAPIEGAESREVAGVLVDRVPVGNARVKRAVYPPGFRWSERMQPHVGTDRCMHAHLGFLARGAIAGEYEDGCTFRHEAPWGSYRLAARAMEAAPGVAPQTTEQPAFEFERDQAARFVFNKPIMGADSGDLIVRNNTTGQTIAGTAFSVQTIPAGTTGWTYRWKYTGGILPESQACDGNDDEKHGRQRCGRLEGNRSSPAQGIVGQKA